jgi:hypothetical protein
LRRTRASAAGSPSGCGGGVANGNLPRRRGEAGVGRAQWDGCRPETRAEALRGRHWRDPQAPPQRGRLNVGDLEVKGFGKSAYLPRGPFVDEGLERHAVLDHEEHAGVVRQPVEQGEQLHDVRFEGEVG